MERLKNYVSESYNELMNNVTWPTWANLTETTGIVLVATLLVSLLIFIMDGTSSQLLKLVYGA
jgi:preprotein translocase subunit SecE